MNVEKTLEQRDQTYGGFINNATISQNLKRLIRRAPNWDALSDDKREALEMIASKMGRLLSGDSEYADNWHDIAGYATLVEQKLLSRVDLAGLQKQRVSSDHG